MPNRPWSRRFINLFVALTVFFVAIVLVRAFEDLMSGGKSNEIRSLLTSIALSLLAYLLKASDSNRQAIQELKRELQIVRENLEALKGKDELQQQALVELETQLAAQERYYSLKEKVDRLLADELP